MTTCVDGVAAPFMAEGKGLPRACGCFAQCYHRLVGLNSEAVGAILAELYGWKLKENPLRIIILVDFESGFGDGRSPAFCHRVELVQCEVDFAFALYGCGKKLDVIQLTFGRAGKCLSGEMISGIGCKMADPERG